MRKSVFLWATLFGLIFNSCKKKDIEVPAYLHINLPKFVVTGGQGTSVQNITYVGVYLNDNLVGVYQTPVTLPVTQKGVVRVEIRPFIKRLAREGVHNYSMMEGHTDSLVTLAEGKTTIINPVFHYQNNTKFAWLDDFNTGSKTLRVDTTQSTTDTIYVTNTHGFGVDSTLYAFIDMGTIDGPFFRIETQDEFILPRDRDVFLEFHYKSNVAFTLGLTEINAGNSVDLPSVTPVPTTEWKKGYVYLNDELLNAPATAKHKVFIRAVNPDPITGQVFLDNFKLMYRE